MFKKTLASAVLKLLEEKNISQGWLSKETEITQRQINNIINHPSNSTLSSLERLCVGLDVTPNDLLIPPQAKIDAEPKEVNEIRINPKNSIKIYSPLCPHCKEPLIAEYIAYCDHCSGRLKWHNYCQAKIYDDTIKRL